jgi:hypothetical protein
MFSIYLLGMMIHRSVKGLNVLACTAMLFLMIDPLQLNSVSFQFSYLALAGILIFYKPIHRLLLIRSTAGRFIWGTVVMSVAAQLFLLPFMIYYFHQVSLISLLSGLIAIPAAYVILCGGLLLCLLHFVLTSAADIWGQLLQRIVGWTNEIMIWLSNLPMSHLADIYLPGLEIALLFSIAVCVSLRLLTKHRWWLFAACLFGLSLGIMHQVSLFATRNLERVAIYSSGKGDLGIDYVSAGVCYTTRDLSGLNVYQAGEIETFRHLSGVRKTHHVSLSDTITCIGLLNLPGRTDTSASTGNRIALITPQCAYDIESGILRLSPHQVLIAPGISRPARTEINRICTANNIPVHDLYRDGSFYLTTKTATNETSWQNISR